MAKRYERLYFGEITPGMYVLKEKLDRGEVAPPSIIKPAGRRKYRVMRPLNVAIFDEPDMIGNAGWIRFDMRPALTEEEQKKVDERMARIKAREESP